MKAAAIVLSYGRPELGELLTQWIKQHRPTPLLVWLDGYEGHVHAPEGVHVHYSPRIGRNGSIGGVRAAAVELARELYSLGPSDGFLVLDDDDYYSPMHALRTVYALERAPGGWTGAARVAYQWHRDMMPPEMTFSEHGPGQHAAQAFRLDTYDHAGGYREADQYEDTELAARIGWQHCSTHPYLTHVRRQFGTTLSAGLKGKAPQEARYDRDQLRAALEPPAMIVPTWRPELAELEIWTRTHEEGPPWI